jgi:hypothetical protein
LELRSIRLIEPSEIEEAAGRWCADPCKVRGKYPKSPDSFITVAMRWFRFADMISTGTTVKSEGESILTDFHLHITIDRGFSTFVVRCYMKRVSHFLLWAKGKELASSISIYAS